MNAYNAHVISKKIFEKELQHQQTILYDIHKKQAILWGSPNFIYNGEVYTYVNNKAIYPLEKLLRPHMKSLIRYQNELSNDISYISSYLRRYASDVTTDLYNVLPSCTHEFLRLINIREPKEIKPVKYDDYDNIAEIIQRRYLERLL